MQRLVANTNPMNVRYEDFSVPEIDCGAMDLSPILLNYYDFTGIDL